MSISLKTHKMLWGRSGNMCAYPNCKTRLVTDIYETDDPSIVGEEAHIVARENGGPRGESTLLTDQRDKYNNLILLCSVHHKIIDDNPRIYTVEKLIELKEKHETLVSNSLLDKEKQKHDEFYSSYIDELCKLAGINNWKNWTSSVLNVGSPRIEKKQFDNLLSLREYLISRIWFDRYENLENAIKNFNNVLSDFIDIFEKYSSDNNPNYYITERFYKIPEHNPERYHELLKRYEYHILLLGDLICELTRAANYIFDQVRQNIFPAFRIHEGVLLIREYPYRVEYKQNEKTKSPYPGLKEFMTSRESRDHNYGSGIGKGDFSTQ